MLQLRRGCAILVGGRAWPSRWVDRFFALRVPSLGTAEVLLLTGLRYWHVECCVESHRRIIYGGVQLSNVPSQQVGPYMLVLG